MSTIKNPIFKAVIDDHTHTLESINFYKTLTSQVLDLNDYEEMRNIKIMGTGKGLTDPYSSHAIGQLVLPKGVREIREEAFAYAKLKSVVWPDNCPVIADSLFRDSTIKSITGIDNIERIEECAFARTNIRSFRVPDKVMVIPDCCFQGAKLCKITNSDHLTDIGDAAFICTEFKAFPWPTNCKKIRSKVFSCCNKLTQVDNMQNVEDIEKAAFEHSSISVVYWPRKCRYIKERTFEGCLKLKEFHGFEHVVAIEKAAFLCSGITDVDLSDSLCAAIGEQAFGSSELQTFKPGYYLQKIDKQAFHNTTYGLTHETLKEELDD